jgi:dCTP deaminase
VARRRVDGVSSRWPGLLLSSLRIMLLSDQDLTLMLEQGELVVEPLGPGAVQPASVEVRLSREFRVFTGWRFPHIDPRVRQQELTAPLVVPEGEPMVLQPGQFALGSTVEVVGVSPRLAARVEGVSSLGRLALAVHSTAGWIDPGFRGRVTLELSNLNQLPILLWPGDRIGQLCVFELSSPSVLPYGAPGRASRYQGQMGATASRSWMPTAV